MTRLLLLVGCAWVTDKEYASLADNCDCEPLAWYADIDRDGHGRIETPILSCMPPVDSIPFSTQTGDCMDLDPSVHPGANELCGDGLDNDCDGMAGCPFPDYSDLSQAEATFTENGSQARLGALVAFAGDTDADGLDEILLGSPGMPGGSGNAWLFADSLQGSVADYVADVRFTMGGADDLFGNVIAPRVDLDKNGFDDVILGAPGFEGDVGAEGAVAVYLAPFEPDVSPVPRLILGTAGSGTGTSLAAGGMADEDLPSLLVGAPAWSDGEEEVGAAFLYIGPPSDEERIDEADLILTGSTDAAGFGVSLAIAPDLDGDGLEDLLVHAGIAGWTYGFHGPIQQDESTFDADFILGDPDPSPTMCDGVVVSLGDTDLDGYADLATSRLVRQSDGVPLDGTVHVYHGGANVLVGSLALSAARTEIHQETTGEGLGGAITVGDVDGDGFVDLMLGLPGADGLATASGVAIIYYGPQEGSLATSDADSFLRGGQSGDQAGASVAIGDDASGDARNDLLVGAPTAPGPDGGGRAYYLLGRAP